MLKKGDIVEIVIDDISEDGKGIGKYENVVIFTDGGTYQDTVKVEIQKVKKRYALGNTVEIIDYSKDRIDSLCEHFDICGGCMYMNLSYDTQLKLKKKQIEDKLIRLGKIENPKVNNVVNLGIDKSYGYRNKGVYEISTGGNIKRKGGTIESLEDVKIGFKARKSNKVIHCENCHIQHNVANIIVKKTKEFMEDDNITAWDGKWKQGLMRNMVVRTSFVTKQVMVTYIINGKGIPNGQKLIDYLVDGLLNTEYELVSVNISPNKEEKSFSIFGKDIIGFAGKNNMEDYIGNIKFEVSPKSFYQVNGFLTESLYEKVLEYADLTGNENVLDLYCGVGSIGLFCAHKAKSVLGIEVVEDAILNANRNSIINGIVNTRFICGKAEEELPKLVAGNYDEDLSNIAKNVDVVILDPPRAGCDEKLLDVISDLSASRIVYVSCEPATLSRDIKKLMENGYSLVEVTPFDMFPWTGCVETVALLSKLDTRSI